MRPNPSAFQITRQTLAEMAALASKSSLDTSALSHTEVQQVLTIYSLIKLLESYQIDIEVALNIKELSHDTSKDTRP